MPKTTLSKKPNDNKLDPPFETLQLRDALKAFLERKVPDEVFGGHRQIGSFKWGVYAFFDYDNEPIYVGQTNEKLSTRIRRHLTNQRTDAVAMNVLDPFEVHTIRVWLLAQFQNSGPKDVDAIKALNDLESAVFL